VTSDDDVKTYCEGQAKAIRWLSSTSDVDTTVLGAAVLANAVHPVVFEITSIEAQITRLITGALASIIVRALPFVGRAVEKVVVTLYI